MLPERAMQEDVPHDAVHLVCSACRTKTWLTTEEAAHCAGTQMRCNKCGRDIDIPAHSPRAELPRRPSAPLEPKSARHVETQSVARSKGQSLPVLPARSPDAERGQRRLSARNDASCPGPDGDAIQRVLEDVAISESKEPATIQNRGAGAPLRHPVRSPRKKTRRKKKKRRQDVTAPHEENLVDVVPLKRTTRANSVLSQFDAWVPLACAVGSFVVYVAVAANTVPQGLVVTEYVWSKLQFILAVILIGTPTLLGASVCLGVCFGDLKTVIIKIPAIVLTQAWAEDLLTLQPLPYVPTFGAWAVTYFLVVNAFELEGLEAQASMCIVRGVHTALYWLVFVGMLTPPLPADGNPPNWLIQPELKEPPIQNAAPTERNRDAKTEKAAKANSASDDGESDPDQPDETDSKSPPAKQPAPDEAQSTAEERSLALTRKFGDALVARDYKRAYGLMSRIYRQQVTLEEFSAIHRQTLSDSGKPWKSDVGLRDTDDGTLTGPELERFRSVPPQDRFAWTYANLTVESDPSGTARCYDCWLLIVKSGKDLRVGAFEYEACE